MEKIEITPRQGSKIEDMESFSVIAMVRGYHVYENIWTAVVGESFPCMQEAGNTFDPFAVAVMRDDTVIGHVPSLSICALFLRRNGSITCQVTGSRRYSDDLAQGGLEVPCVLCFDGDAKVTTKAKKLVESALATAGVDTLPNKQRRVADPAVEPDTAEDSSPEAMKEWVQFGRGIVLTIADKERILAGEKLDDRHISFAQSLIKKQFPEIAGLRSTLQQAKKQPTEGNKNNYSFSW